MHEFCDCKEKQKLSKHSKFQLPKYFNAESRVFGALAGSRSSSIYIYFAPAWPGVAMCSLLVAYPVAMAGAVLADGNPAIRV